jgi:hypothetical protein
MRKKALLLPMVFTLLISGALLAAPPMPTDLQMVEPDPSLPKELRGFVGKWKGAEIAQTSGGILQIEFFIIIEKIDEKNANLYFWRTDMNDWKKDIAEVIKDENKLQFMGKSGINELTLDKFGKMVLHVPGVRKGMTGFGGIVYLKRVP